MKELAIFVVGLAILAISTTALSDNYKDGVPGVIKLPQPRTDGSISVDQALLERRSIRKFADGPLAIDEISKLLWACQGITDDKGHRTAPSAMATYPLDVYLLAGNVTDLPSGIYRYSPQGNNLTVITTGNKIRELFNSTSGPADWRENSPAVFVITGRLNSFNKISSKDLSRFVYIEAGAAAENLLLEVVSLGLGSTYTAGFDENKIMEYLGLSQGDEPIGVLPVGRRL
jgi:SagB-type dehydrogenase family enzyme